MRAVVSRVRSARVTVDGVVVGELDGPGLLVLLGVHADDSPTGDGVATMARKLHELRLLRPGEHSDGEGTGERSNGKDTGERSDGEGTRERSCAETGAGLLVVSQFTLYGDTRRGRRPSWSAAARPEVARPVVAAVVAALRTRGGAVAEGAFGADMLVESVGDGPFTVLVET